MDLGGDNRHQPGCRLLPAWILLALAGQAQGQNCPSPIVVSDGQCNVQPGTTVTVAANAVGVSAPSGAIIHANGITDNLAGANATGLLAQGESIINFNGSALRTTSTAGNASGQIGVRSVGVGSQIAVVGSSIQLSPGGTSSPANLRGVSAEGGALVTLDATDVQVRGGSNALNNYGMQALGVGSEVRMSGGSVDTSSRGAFGVLAQDGGLVTLTGTQITTGGAQNTITNDGSHAIVARGAGSRINGQNVVANTSGTLANVVRADSGAAVALSGSQLSHTGNGNVTFPAAAIRVTTGGQFILTGTSTISTTGALYSPGLLVEGAGSTATISDSGINVGGARSFGVSVKDGATVSLVRSTVAMAPIAAAGPFSPAIQAEGVGTRISLQGGAVSTESATAYGVRALSGSAITLDGTSITTAGVDAAAISAGSAAVDARNVTIVTRGNDNAMGALADLGGTVSLTGGSITTYGSQVRASAFAHALGARNPGGVLEAQGIAARTFGTYAMGVWADDGGVATVNDVTVNTEGSHAIGVLAIVEQRGAQFPGNRGLQPRQRGNTGQFCPRCVGTGAKRPGRRTGQHHLGRDAHHHPRRGCGGPARQPCRLRQYTRRTRVGTGDRQRSGRHDIRGGWAWCAIARHPHVGPNEQRPAAPRRCRRPWRGGVDRRAARRRCDGRSAYRERCHGAVRGWLAHSSFPGRLQR